MNNLIDVNKGKKVNYFNYNLNDLPNGGENNDVHLNNNQKVDENNYENNNNSSVIIVSEQEIERHLQLIDILIELELVK